jgi:hypothetical protein
VVSSVLKAPIRLSSAVIMGKQEGEDGHDVIEELAKMDWYVVVRQP